MNRRAFLEKSLMALALGEVAPSLLSRTALAARAGGNRILVLIQLSGGNDSLNTLVPYTQDLYYRNRPNLALKRQEVLTLDPSLALHPALRPLMPFWEAGELGLIPQVGYPGGNRSHFVSMAIWHTADPSGKTAEGWLGRYMDAQDDPYCETNLGVSSPLALRGDHHTAPSIVSLEGFQLRLPRNLASSFEKELKVARSGVAEEVRQAMLSMNQMTQKVGQIRTNIQNRVEYPRDNFGRSMSDIARMIAADFGSTVYYTQLGGFDTHAGQLTRQAELLGSLGQTLSAFRQDMRAVGRDKDVMLVAFSEFGRRVAENASFGTDHGHGGLMLVLGGGVKGGIFGSEPDLNNLDQGDLPFKTDFRKVYGSALQWIGADPKSVLGQDFGSLPLF